MEAPVHLEHVGDGGRCRADEAPVHPDFPEEALVGVPDARVAPPVVRRRDERRGDETVRAVPQDSSAA